jgi:hypothetical protein
MGSKVTVETAPNHPVEVTILMPCLNEAETIEMCIQKAKRFLEQHNLSGEVIVGDNGSTDGSQEIARRNGARVVDISIRGYGAALSCATNSARGKYVIMGDSDGSYDFSNLMPFLEKLRAGYDLVVGNRFQGGIKPGAMPWKNKWIGTPALSGAGRLFFKCPVRDFNCGLRGYARDAFKKLDLRTTGMEFATEMVVKATLLEMRIAEVPTTLDPDGRSHPPHLRPWRDGWRHLRFMLLYSPRWLFLYPGTVLALAGLITGLSLVRGPRRIGSITLDIHTLFFACIGILVGFQSILFAVFGKTFAITERLLPSDRKFDRAFELFHLGTCLVAGVVLVGLGFFGASCAVLTWGKQGFGPLVPTRVMRLAIPSGLSLALGFQMILSGFFLGLLRMGRK